MNIFSDPRTNAHMRVAGLAQLASPGTRRQLTRYMIIVLRCGTHSLRRDNELLLIDQPSIVTMTPGTLFEVLSSLEGTAEAIEFNREFYCVEYHDAEVSCNGLLFNGAIHAPMLPLSPTEVGTVDAILAAMENEFRNGDDLLFDMLRVHVKQLIITSTRIARQHLQFQCGLNDTSVHLVRKYSALVEKHFRIKHKVAEYAEMLNRSPKTIINVFARLGGRSALQVIHDRLAVEAQRMLLLSNMSAKEIAFDLGFSEASQFHRFVKKMTGNTTQVIRGAGYRPPSNDDPTMIGTSLSQSRHVMAGE